MKNHNQFYILAAALAALSLVLSACGAASASSAKFPTGKFVSVSDANNAYEFNADNTWAYYLGGLMGAKGTYRVEGNRWIEEGTPECPFAGSYTWTYDGKTLAFQVEGDDNCAPRKEATHGQSFTLSK